jgi:succinate-semialdehyde dehydrogenase/glutarate-semialdehyde dehydrogenase
MPYQTINPANCQTLATYPCISDEEMIQKLDAAHAAFKTWRKISFLDRSNLMNAASTMLLENKEKYGKIMTLEMGKPLKQSIAEVEKSALCCRYYADNAEKFLAPKVHKTDYKFAEVHFEPLGIVYAIMPWNFPLWQVFRCAVPAIMAGNTVVLKHAQNVPQSALAIQEVFEKAGFPHSIFTNLFIDHDQSDKVIDFHGVMGVSLTGSEKAGGHVASLAGKNIKHSVLELGGSDPFIILADADIETAAKIGVESRMRNSGQSCISAKRFIVVKEVADAFIEKYVEEVRKIKTGDPMQDDTFMGPLARIDLVDTIENQVNRTLEMGAKLLIGGKRMDRDGCYYEPTVIKDIPKNSPAYNEELFGPVASIFVVNNEEQAIETANDTSFGLGAALWTKNTKKALELSKEIQSGSVYINTFVKSDPRIPFGGIKKSGYGRELSHEGIKEFVNMKTVCIA